MIVPQTSEYALRIMAYLALLPSRTYVNASDIARDTDIPKPYTSKIVRKLVVANLLDSHKGPGGGVAINLPLESIRFINILEAVDYESDPKHCAYGWGKCKADKPCPLHPTWSQLKEDFHRWADRATLMDVKNSCENLKYLRHC